MIPMDRGEGGTWHRNPAENGPFPTFIVKEWKTSCYDFPPAECLCAWNCPESLVMHQDDAFRVDGAFRHLECCRLPSLERRMAKPEFDESSEKILRDDESIGRTYRSIPK